MMKRTILAFAGCLLIVFSFAVRADAAGRKAKNITVEHPWASARVAYLGDSITDQKVLKDDVHYWGFLQQWLGIDPLVYGRSGHQWHQIAGQADKLMSEHGEDFDAIMVFVGTNDYNAGVPIGEWFTEETVTVNADGQEVKRIRRIPVMDNNTYRGRINMILDKLKKMYPTKQIVLLTPIHRAYAKFSDRNVQPDESHQNACGEYVDAYIQSIKEASSIWSVPVIDTHALSGLFPMHKEQQMYFPGGNDWLHPDEDGHRRFAACLMYQLLTIPCRL